MAGSAAEAVGGSLRAGPASGLQPVVAMVCYEVTIHYWIYHHHGLLVLGLIQALLMTMARKHMRPDFTTPTIWTALLVFWIFCESLYLKFE